MTQKKCFIGMQVFPEEMESIKKQLRLRSVSEDRTITVSLMLLEALMAYGIAIDASPNAVGKQ